MKPILFIDDDVDIIETYTDLFDVYEISESIELHRGGEVISDNLLLNRKLIITDLSMPVQSGKEVLAQVKNVSAQTPVWVLSGNVDVNVEKEVLELGASRVLNKPLAVDKFIEELKRVLKD